MGDNQVTSTTSTVPNNPKITETINKLLGGVDDAWTTGPSVFDESLYGGVGDTTKSAWDSALTAARNPAFTSALTGATGYAGSLIGNGGLTSRSTSDHSDPYPTPYNPDVPHHSDPFPIQQPPGGTGHSTPFPIQQQPGGSQNGGQVGDLATTRNIGSQFGTLAASQRTPGIYESTMLGTAQGNNLNGNDPLFERDLSRTLDSAGAAVNSRVGAGGRFGSNLHADTLARTIGGIDDAARLVERNSALDRQQQALAGIGGERQQRFGNEAGALTAQGGQAGTAFGMEQQGVNNTFNAASSLPGLYESSLLPSTTMGTIGAAQDTDTQAGLLGRNDLFRRKNDAKTDWLAKLSSILGVNAGASGSTTTNTEPGTPWWQSGLSLIGQFV